MGQFSVLVEVQLKEGISDPQGATIERAVPTLGFDGVSNVRMGKAIRLTIEAANEAEAESKTKELCDHFLTNPVMETAVITVGTLLVNA